MEILIIGLLIVIALGVGYIVFVLINNKKEPTDTINISELFEGLGQKNERALREEMTTNRKEGAESEKRVREEIAGLFKGFGEPVERRMTELASTQNKNFEGFSTKLTELIDKNDAKMEKVKEAVEKKLDGIQKDNTEKLEAMRQTVDEKLQSTIEKRFGESFKMVSERLELVHKGLGEMQTIAVGVGDLKKVLSNIKTRGTWGEAQLGNLISEILTPEQYETNVKTKKGSLDAVEFGIKLPGQGDEIQHVWLPIDAKFPLEDYQRLLEAQEKADIESIKESIKALEQRVKGEAKCIKDKYINPPYTTDFGVLFLPVESLYAEVLRIPGLSEQIRRDFKVIVTGPTTIQAILNSLQMGFKTLAIQKRSSEVWDVLGKVKTEFGNFGVLLEKTHKKLQEASTTIESAAAKTRNIQGKLNRVQELPVTASETPVIALTESDEVEVG
ncbi:TPA: DNA recombination protein RmuC [Candidatus Woesearchaeota archaeon]|nr:DNA recombination protein RmuC [Candidatus Woesearchaeota archaeon]